MNINIYQKNVNSTVSNFKALAMGSKLLGPIDSKSLLRPRVKDTHLDHTHTMFLKINASVEKFEIY